jgi:hypothetical protein
MNFKRWLRNWLNKVEDAETIHSISSNKARLYVTADRDSLFDSNPLRLNVYRAAGGIIVEAKTWDEKRDRTHNTLHIIPHDQDLSKCIDRIITMESLRG